MSGHGYGSFFRLDHFDRLTAGVADYFESLGKMTPPVKINQRKVTQASPNTVF